MSYKSGPVVHGLSEEQQACSWRRLSASLTNFKAKSIDIESASTSGPEGSTAVGVGDSVKIDTLVISYP